MKKVSLVVITGDRGLCGGYNSQIIKSTTKRIAKLESQGIKVFTITTTTSNPYELNDKQPFSDPS